MSEKSNHPNHDEDIDSLLRELDDELSKSNNEEFSEEELEALFKEVMEDAEQTSNNSKTIDASDKLNDKKPKSSSLNSNPPSSQNKQNTVSNNKKQNYYFKRIIPIFLSILILLGMFSAYIVQSRKNNTEQLIASRALADLSMAFTNAILDSEKVSSSSATPILIDKNLEKILPDYYQSFYKIQDNGNLAETSYKIRFFITEEGDNFFLLAQPTPSYLRAILPKPVILIDSLTMTLRQTYDLETLQTILPHSQSITGKKFKALVERAKNIKKIPLSSIEDENSYLGYKTSDELLPYTDIVYNAPRYFNFSEPLTSQASLIGSKDSSLTEIEKLANLIGRFAKYDNMVLYFHNGIASAIDGYIALKLLEEQPEFNIAYLVFDSSGNLQGAKILEDDLLKAQDSIVIFKMQSLDQPKDTPDLEEDTLEQEEKNIESYPSAYYIIKNILSERNTALQKRIDNINHLLADSQSSPSYYIENDLHNSIEEYMATVKQYRQIISNTLKSVYDQYYQNNPAETLIEFNKIISELSLEAYNLESEPINNSIEENDEYRFQDTIDEIYKTTTLLKLNKSLSEINLDLQNITTEELENLQEAVIEQLADLLFLSTEDISKYKPSEGHDIITDILNKIGITEGEVLDFYLQEFDRMSEPHLKTQDIPLSTDIVNEVPVEKTNPQNKTEDPKALTGIDILEKEKSKPASPERDDQLYHAISLLSLACQEDQVLWNDLLEALAIVTETPKNEIKTYLEFIEKTPSIGSSIKKDLRRYINNKKYLASSLEDYESNFNMYKASQELNLLNILTEVKVLEDNSQKLASASRDYLFRLEEYAAEYIAAEKQGLFENDDRQKSESNRLLYKVQLTKNFNNAIQDLTAKIERNCLNIADIALQGIKEIKEHQTITSENAVETLKQIKSINFPELTDNDITDQFETVIAINFPLLKK